MQRIIVAVSAPHMYARTRPSSPPGSPSRRDSPGPLLMDALLAKQVALGMMPAALRSIDATGCDVVLAASLFLLNIELMGTGRQAWRPHLEGAGRIIGLIRPISEAGGALRD